MRIDAQVAGDALEWLQLVLQRTQDLRPVTSKIARGMRDEIIMNFVEQGRPKWQKLTDKWKRYKVSHGYSTQILVQTGKLRSSFGIHYDKQKATVFTDVPYSIYHVTGTKRMPKRDFTTIPKTTLDSFSQMVNDYIIRG